MIHVAVLGYGTVGSGVLEVFRMNQEKIDRCAGDQVRIKYILDLRDFPGDPAQELIVHDFEQIINDVSIDIVVEVMGGLDPAYTFVKRSLEAGKKRSDVQQGSCGGTRVGAFTDSEGASCELPV